MVSTLQVAVSLLKCVNAGTVIYLDVAYTVSLSIYSTHGYRPVVRILVGQLWYIAGHFAACHPLAAGVDCVDVSTETVELRYDQIISDRAMQQRGAVMYEQHITPSRASDSSNWEENALGGDAKVLFTILLEQFLVEFTAMIYYTINILLAFYFILLYYLLYLNVSIQPLAPI